MRLSMKHKDSGHIPEIHLEDNQPDVYNDFIKAEGQEIYIVITKWMLGNESTKEFIIYTINTIADLVDKGYEIIIDR